MFKETRAVFLLLVASAIAQPPGTNSVSRPRQYHVCLTDSSEPGVCVLQYNCINGTLTFENEATFDYRSYQPCKEYQMVCCAMKKTIQTTTEQQVIHKGCGHHNPGGVGGRIQPKILPSGSQAAFGEFPWIVAVYSFDVSQSEDHYLGVGSLIHPKVVLTAAHILFNADYSTLEVRVGEWNVQMNSELYTHETVSLATVVMHPELHKDNLFNDVAILFLNQAVELGPHIGVACLPNPEEFATPNTECYVAGWGQDDFEYGRYQSTLKKIKEPVVEASTCEAMFQRTRLGNIFKLHPSFMCAGGIKGSSACTGDGGSPLMCPIQSQGNRLVQRGILAWGIGCGQQDVPEAYVDVAKLRSWIDSEVSLFGYDTSTYDVKSNL